MGEVISIWYVYTDYTVVEKDQVDIYVLTLKNVHYVSEGVS